MQRKWLVGSVALIAVMMLVGIDGLLSVPAAASGVTPLGNISAADVGKRVTVDAKIVGTERYGAGFKLYVNDGTGQLALVLREQNYVQILLKDRLNIQIGATVHATGRVIVDLVQMEQPGTTDKISVNEVQVIPTLGNDVWVVSPSELVLRKYDLGAITGNDHNAIVLVEGVLTDAQLSATGVNFLLSDVTGKQNIRVDWLVLRNIPDLHQLRIGIPLRVIGRVRAAQKRGTEIEAELPTDIQIIARTK